MTAVLDHLAVGTPALSDGWELFGGVLGGTWAYGGDSPGYWWGQLNFAAGPKIELLTPTGGPDAAFLERFLALRGAGPHHLNFLVTDIGDTLARIRAHGSSPSASTWTILTGRKPSCTRAMPTASSSRSPSKAVPRARPGRQSFLTRSSGRLRPHRAPRRRPGWSHAAVPGRPGRAARGGRGGRRRADLARRQADQADARGRPAARRVAAPCPLHPGRRGVHRSGPRARGPAGQAPRPDGGTRLTAIAAERGPATATGARSGSTWDRNRPPWRRRHAAVHRDTTRAPGREITTMGVIRKIR